MKTYINASGRIYFGDPLNNDLEATPQQIADFQTVIGEMEVSESAKARLTQLRKDIFPDLLIFLATMPGAPQSIKSAALVAATEKVKVKP